MFTAAMFTTVQKVGTIHMPRGYEMDKLWYIHIMEYNSAFIVSVLQLNIPVRTDPNYNFEWKNKHHGKYCIHYNNTHLN